MRRSLSRSEPAPTGPTVYPEAWWARAQELVASADRVVEAPDPLGGLGPEIRQAAFRLRGRPKEDEALARIALAIEAEIHPALLMCLLPGIDRVSHVLWAGLEPPERYPPELRRPADERAAMAEALEAYYVFTDALIGALAARFGPDDLVVVVSDHGFEAGSPLEFLTGAHESEHAAEGVIFARGPGIPAGQPAGPIGIADVTPTVLAWLGLPVAEDMDGRPAAFLSGPAFETIPTYDTAAVARLPLAPSGAEGEILDQLRELGYLEQEPEAPRSGSSP